MSLEVENIRCFGPRQLLNLADSEERPAKWTVLLGDNGVGKTTILQLLASMEEITSKGEDGGDFAHPRISHVSWGNFSSFVRHKGTQQSRISARILTGRTLEGEGQNPEVSEYSYEFTARHLEGVRSAVKALKCFGYGAGRRMGPSTLSERESTDAVASLFSEDISLLNAEEWLLQTDYSATKESPVQSAAIWRRDQVETILVDLLPDVSEIRIVPPIASDEQVSAIFRTPYGWVDIDRLGLGYRTMIAWTVDFAARMFERYPNSKDPLSKPAVVLIDEIDLHLHPRWQRQIISYLDERFPNTQFIVTAHSPLIVQSAVGANIAVLRREGDHVVIDNDPAAVRGWRVDQILTSDLFGLPSARPPQVDEWVRERDRILAKKRITKNDRDRLKTLEERITNVPGGESPEDMEAMRIIRQAARHLKKAEN